MKELAHIEKRFKQLKDFLLERQSEDPDADRHDEGDGYNIARVDLHEIKLVFFALVQERDRLRLKLEMWQDGNIMSEQHHEEIKRLTAERDEARQQRDEAKRILKAVVDMMRDNMAPDATHPKHLCDFIHRPDIAMCKVCEDWTDAMVMCYPDDFQDKEDGK